MRCNQIGVEVSREEFVSFLNSVQPGQFFHIRGYKSQNDDGVVSDDPKDASEIADFFVRYGIKYDNFKSRDIATLKSILSGERREVIGVLHGVWIPEDQLQTIFLSPEQISGLPDNKKVELVEVTARYEAIVGGAAVMVQQVGTVDLMNVEIFSNRKAKSKVATTIGYRLPSSHPLVIAAIGGEDLQGTMLQGLFNPAPPNAEHEKQAQSFYSLEKDGKATWYLRDVAIVSKVVRREGVHRFKANLPIKAIKDSLADQCLLKNKYRQFILNEGNFSSITIDGQAILVDGSDEGVFFALPEHVKELAATEVVGS